MPTTAPKLPRPFCFRPLWPGLGLLALAGATLCAAATLRAQDDVQRTVVAVKIEGNETIPESVILQKIQTQPSRSLTERQIREDIRSLMGTRWFFSVEKRFEETPEGTVLIFTVHERPIVQKVTFLGNRKVKLKHLQSWTGLKAGSPFDHEANRQAVNRIEQEYRDKGFYFVKVTLEKGGNPGEREIVFRIDEGPKVRVQHRTFEGNDFWNNGDLKKNLASKEALLGEIPGFPGIGGLYHPETLPQDTEALKQFYRSVGFFDAEVRVEPRFSPDRASVDLHFTIKEGVRYKVRDIRYQGNDVIPTAQLKGESKLNSGDYFNAQPLSRDLRRMLKYYGDLGHYFARVNPVPHFTEEPGIVDLVFEIDEDRPRFIREINVMYDGDYPHTKHTVVLDRMQVAPGDLAVPDRIRRGKSRLSGSGLFEPGIAFDVRPVDPGEMMFSSASRTLRGQSQAPPGAGPVPTWTDRFSRYTAESAARILSGAEEFPEEFAAIRSPQSRSADSPAGNSSGIPRPAHGQFQAASHTIALQQRPTGGHVGPAANSPAANSPAANSAAANSAAADNPDDRPVVQQMPLARPAVPQSVRPAGHENQIPPAEHSLHQMAKPVLRSEILGFRGVAPGEFFGSDSDGFVSADSGSDDGNGPVIRAQNPGGFPDEAVPRPTDPILEGSPYRQQFNAVPPGWVDIDVQASEGRTGRLMFGAGVNSDAGVVGSFVWDESNFDLFRPPQTFADILEGRAWRGGGQRFRAEAAPGAVVSRYAISWTDPYFLYSDYSLTLSGFYFNRFYPDWDEDRVGGRIGVGRQWTPEWSTNAALRLEEVELSKPRTPTPAVVQEVVGQNFLSTVRLSASHDTRDMAIMPGEGHFLDVGYEQAFGDFNYPRVEGEMRQYFTLYNRPDGSGRQVLTLAGNLGWSGDDTPVFERYYAGGFQSFRGFSFRGVTPRVGAVAVGGTWQMLGTVEYRVPVTADDMINVVAFSDFGTIEEDVSVDNFRATAGLGLRIVIPAMGPVPLAFDFAFPIKSQPFDDERIFSFYVGINR